MNSSIVANSSRTSQQRRRGTYVTLEFKALKAKYGPALAKSIRDERKKIQEEKPASDDTIYWMKHPDFGDHTDVGPPSLCQVVQMGGSLLMFVSNVSFDVVFAPYSSNFKPQTLVSGV